MLHDLRQLYKNPQTRPIAIRSIVFLAILMVVFYGFFGMAKSYVRTAEDKNSKKKELESVNKRLDLLNNESGLKSEEQKEKILREKLHMVKPGEDLIIINSDIKPTQ